MKKKKKKIKKTSKVVKNERITAVPIQYPAKEAGIGLLYVLIVK